MKEKLKKLCLKAWFFVPQALPTTGLPEFQTFFGKLCDAYELPNHPSYEHAVATMIMNLSPTTDKVAPRFFAKSIRKAMANEIAYSRIQQFRAEEKARAKAEAEAAQRANEAVVSEA